MPYMSLLLDIDQPELRAQLLQSKAIHQFNLSQAERCGDWVNELDSFMGSVIVAQVDDFTEADCNSLLASKRLSDIDVIFISHGAPNPAIDKAMRSGVSYHLCLPLEGEYFEEILTEIHSDLQCYQTNGSTTVGRQLDQYGLLVGSSPVMRKLYRMLRKAASTDSNILIIGESGAGKELVANTIHLVSDRSHQPFVAVNCGAITPELIESELFGHVKGAFTGANKDRDGVFQQAKGGTLFLDEITEMPISQQVKLLRVLEAGEFRPVGSDKLIKTDVRVVSATNRDPIKAIEEEHLREDLYFRLAHFPIQVPPLRTRGDDISGLAQHFLAYRNVEESADKKISVKALDAIRDYDWPGNVRELKHTLERAYILAEAIIEPTDLLFQYEAPEQQAIEIDPAFAEAAYQASQDEKTIEVPTGVPLMELEKAAILQTLEKNSGNKTETAQQLGVSVKTLYNKLEKYQVDEIDLEKSKADNTETKLEGDAPA